jgi:hypothetical protein
MGNNPTNLLCHINFSIFNVKLGSFLLLYLLKIQFWMFFTQYMSTIYRATALYICRDNNVATKPKLKGNFEMKTIATLIATLVAASAFAAEPAKAPATTAPVATPAPAASAPAATPAKKEEKKATKEAVKNNASKSATPAPAAKDQKAETPKK